MPSQVHTHITGEVVYGYVYYGFFRSLALPRRAQASEPEVGRLERRRESILEGVRKGYEHAHLLLRRTVPGHATANLDGRQAALQVQFYGLKRVLRIAGRESISAM